MLSTSLFLKYIRPTVQKMKEKNDSREREVEGKVRALKNLRNHFVKDQRCVSVTQSRKNIL